MDNSLLSAIAVYRAGGSPGNNPPAITSNGGGNTAAVSIAENIAAVTTVTATDPDAGQTLSYSINGGADASKFAINVTTGALAFLTAPNFEAPTDAGGNNVYDVTVQVSDGNGGSDTQAIAVSVTDQNEVPNQLPTITSNGGGNTAAVSIAENGTAVTTVTATDPDAGQTLSYSINGGADASKFAINVTTGALAFLTAPNFEAPTDAGGNNVYDVTVQVSDGNGGSDTQAIAVTVTNQNEFAVGRYWIADAGTDQKIVEILNGSTIDNALFAGKSITIVGEGPGESFKFNFDNGTVTRTENTAPYALMGDQNGDLFGGLTLSPASHTLVTEIYSADNGAGTKLGQDTLDFSIFTAGSQPPSADVSVTQTGGSTAVIEGAATDTVLVALTSQPTANVTVTVNGNTDVSASPTTLTFTSANWNTAQTVTVTAVDDTLVEGPESANITFASSSSDARYNGLSIAPVPVAITDNDQSAVGAVDDTATTEVNTPIFIDVLANDGGDKETGTLGIVSGPADGTIEIIANEILYTPRSGFTGTTTFTYSFVDGPASGQATVTVNTLASAAATSNTAEQIYLAWIDDAATTLTVAWRLAAGISASEIQYRAVGETKWTGDQSILHPSGTNGGELYEATLRGLSPATEYEFRARLDNGSWSQIYDAWTAPGPEQGDFDAVFFADTGLIGRLDGLATGTAQVRDEIAALDPTLLLGGGDYAYFDTDKRFGDLNSTIDAWFDQWALPLSQAPFMTTYGNHEVVHGEGFDDWHDRFPQPDQSDLAGRAILLF